MSNDADPLDLAIRELSRAAQESDALRGLPEPERSTVAHRFDQPINPLWLLAPEPVASALGGNWDHELVKTSPLTSVRASASRHDLGGIGRWSCGRARGVTNHGVPDAL